MKKTNKKAKKQGHKSPARPKGRSDKKASTADVKNKAGVMPLGDRVLVKPLSVEEMTKTTSFGIIIPDTVGKEKPEQGTVVAVGPGRKNEKGERVALDVKAGDRVYFKKPWEEPMKIDGVEYYVLPESDITLIIKN